MESADAGEQLETLKSFSQPPPSGIIEALIELYLDVKVRSNDEVSSLD